MSSTCTNIDKWGLKYWLISLSFFVIIEILEVYIILGVAYFLEKGMHTTNTIVENVAPYRKHSNKFSKKDDYFKEIFTTGLSPLTKVYLKTVSNMQLATST